MKIVINAKGECDMCLQEFSFELQFVVDDLGMRIVEAQCPHCLHVHKILDLESEPCHK